MDSVLKTAEKTTYTLQLFLTLVAVISLVVGGIGVMNIMLVSVTERTREIGIRMAVGARASDVLQQFLIEAVLVCLVGGALGISLSMFIAFMLQLFLPGWEIGFSLTALASAFLCSTFTGILFGWLPARNAARLDPVDALARSNLADVICRPDKMQQCRHQALALNKNASRSGWHFASWMYTMRQRSYATASASMGTMTLA